MPAGHEVRPRKWSNVLDIFDCGEFSAIWGNYERSSERCLGIRWNGENEDLGFPNSAGYPIWFVVPKFLAKSILHELWNSKNGHKNNIEKAIEELARF